MVSQVLFSSKSQEHTTPQDFFNKLNDEFNFICDLAATKENALCVKFFSKEDDALSQEWPKGNCFCNPPYGRDLGSWILKAKQEALSGTTTVMLIPARTDTRWFHDWVLPYRLNEIRFIKGRLKFGGSKNPAPFPSMLIIFRSDGRGCFFSV